MITAIVNLELPAPISLAEAEQAFTKSVPKYQGFDGLVRKYYLLSETARRPGGVYLWRSRRHAERLYTTSGDGSSATSTAASRRWPTSKAR